MTIHQLGLLTLNLSFFTYVCLYMPQVMYNLRRRSTEGLSYLMHCILIIAYIADLMYGFGRHMEWQYRMVSVIGVSLLFVQHVQIAWYQGIRRQYVFSTIGLILLFIGMLVSITVLHLSPAWYIHAGLISWLGGVLYALPQIRKNMQLQQATALSLVFLGLDISCSLLDAVSAWCLGWDYPSKYGSPLEVVMCGILLFQAVYSRVRLHPAVAL